MKSLRIAMLLNRYLPIIGGAEMFANRLSQRLVRRGHTVEVITRQLQAELPETDLVQGIPVRRLRPVGLSHLANALMVGRMFWHLLRHGRQYDVWHVHGVGPVGMAALLASRITGVPVVFKLLGEGNLRRQDSAGVQPSAYTRILRSILLPDFVWRAILQQCAGIAAISKQIMDDAKSLGFGDRVKFIPNGIDTDVFKPIEDAARAELINALGLPAGKMFLLFSGRLVPGKRADVLLAAMPDILKQFPNCHAVLCGSGAFQADSVEADLRAQVKASGIAAHVTFAGAVTNIHEYLQIADVFVFPSEQEGLPVALLEAMATGLPIVASEIDGVTDLVDEDTGWLVSVGEAELLAAALVEVLNHPELARQKANRARERVAGQFSINTAVKKYESLYFDVVRHTKTTKL
jgi:glycosyltransferase involved in cell wall biosynthesis